MKLVQTITHRIDYFVMLGLTFRSRSSSICWKPSHFHRFGASAGGCITWRPLMGSGVAVRVISGPHVSGKNHRLVGRSLQIAVKAIRSFSHVLPGATPICDGPLTKVLAV